MRTKHKAPGKAHREGISLVEVFRMFPDYASAEAWFVARRWPTGIACPHCGSLNVQTVAKHKTMPYRCREKECAKAFQPEDRDRHGGFEARDADLDDRHVPALDQPQVGLVHEAPPRSGHQPAVGVVPRAPASGRAGTGRRHLLRPGGSGRDVHGRATRQHAQGEARGADRPRGGREDRNRRGEGPGDESGSRGGSRAHRQATIHGFVAAHTDPQATVYSDEAAVYASLPNPHEAVNHSALEYVRGDVHTNGVESFWSMLKRAHKGTFQKMSPKHLGRYVAEFQAKHNLRDMDTLDIMGAVVLGMDGKRLCYRELIADNGLDSGARS